MAAGADSIDDLNVIRSGGMKQLFGGVYAAATLGQFLREFTPATRCSWPRYCGLIWLTSSSTAACCRTWEQRAFVDVDSLLRPVFGHHKQGASSVTPRSPESRCCAAACPRWSPRSAPRHGAPVIAGIRLRAGKACSGKNAASMVAEAIRTARTAGACGEILVRGDSAYGNSAMVNACLDAGVHFSVVLDQEPRRHRCDGCAFPKMRGFRSRYPNAVLDPDTGGLISDAQVAEVEIHRLRLHQDAGHRAADRAPRARPRQDR